MVASDQDGPGDERPTGHRDSASGTAKSEQAGGAQRHTFAADGSPHHAELTGAPTTASPRQAQVIRLPAREISERVASRVSSGPTWQTSGCGLRLSSGPTSVSAWTMRMSASGHYLWPGAERSGGRAGVARLLLRAGEWLAITAV